MDLNALLEQWRYLDLRYFSRLDHRFAGSVKKFELCLLRYYLIYGTFGKDFQLLRLVPHMEH